VVKEAVMEFPANPSQLDEVLKTHKGMGKSAMVKFYENTEPLSHQIIMQSGIKETFRDEMDFLLSCSIDPQSMAGRKGVHKDAHQVEEYFSLDEEGKDWTMGLREELSKHGLTNKSIPSMIVFQHQVIDDVEWEPRTFRFDFLMETAKLFIWVEYCVREEAPD
jgi:hypothetical protein